MRACVRVRVRAVGSTVFSPHDCYTLYLVISHNYMSKLIFINDGLSRQSRYSKATSDG